MEKKNVVFLTVLAIATLLTAVVGTTFAYFTATVTGNEQATTTTVTTAQDLGVTYSDGAAITLPNAVPGDKSVTKTISVRNDSAATPLEYEIKWTDVSNSFQLGTGDTDDLVYTVVRTDSESGTTTYGGTAANTAAFTTANGVTMTSGKAYSCANHTATITNLTTNCELTVYKAPSAQEVLVSSTVQGGKTHTYQVTIYFLETGVLQNSNQSTNGYCTDNGVRTGTVTVSGQAVTATSENCVAANGANLVWHAANTVQFSSTLQTNLVNSARVTAGTITEP